MSAKDSSAFCNSVFVKKRIEDQQNILTQTNLRYKIYKNNLKSYKVIWPEAIMGKPEGFSSPAPNCDEQSIYERMLSVNDSLDMCLTLSNLMQ